MVFLDINVSRCQILNEQYYDSQKIIFKRLHENINLTANKLLGMYQQTPMPYCSET